MQIRTGAIDVLQRALGRLSPDPRLAALLVAWFFALFLEGAAGFGTTIALAARMLVSLGFQPVVAVTMALTGHVAGVSFGAVGTPILPSPWRRTHRCGQPPGYGAAGAVALTTTVHRSRSCAVPLSL